MAKESTAKQFDVSRYQMVPTVNKKTVKIEGTGDKFEVTLKQLSWSKRNQLVSKCLQLGSDGTNSFNGDLYIRECLKEMIVDAPWGRTTESFLVSIDNRLGSALEQLVPNAFGSSDTGALGPEEIKKG